MRIHRSWIVDIEQVREAQPWTKRGWILPTRRGLEAPMGQRYGHVLSKILRSSQAGARLRAGAGLPWASPVSVAPE
jgi:hypothetical protein